MQKQRSGFLVNIKHIAKAMLQRFPVLQDVALPVYRYLRSTGVSEDYKRVGTEEIDRVKRELVDSWRNEQIPSRQRELVERQLSEYRSNAPNPVFDALTEILRRNISRVNDLNLLEIGCSSGYYSDVLRIKGILARYRGCDYSEAFIALARQCHPNVPFDIEDAVNLSYPAASFDIVVSGGCILHIVDYDKAISEAVRVSKKYVVFHRTPVLHLQGPVIYTKKAYEIDTMELHFNEQKLIEVFSAYGLCIIDVNTHSISWDSKLHDALAMKTYLCRKSSNINR